MTRYLFCLIVGSVFFTGCNPETKNLNIIPQPLALLDIKFVLKDPFEIRVQNGMIQRFAFTPADTLFFDSLTHFLLSELFDKKNELPQLIDPYLTVTSTDLNLFKQLNQVPYTYHPKPYSKIYKKPAVLKSINSILESKGLVVLTFRLPEDATQDSVEKLAGYFQGNLSLSLITDIAIFDESGQHIVTQSFISTSNARQVNQDGERYKRDLNSFHSASKAFRQAHIPPSLYKEAFENSVNQLMMILMSIGK